MKKRALLVGINYVGTSSRLRGCINDSNNMKAMLSSKGFVDIKQIHEKEATTAGIIAGLEWLVADLTPGDVIVFHYSGHGSQLPSSHEEDGFEEIICPIDLDWMSKVITDDTLRDIFNKVPNGVNTTVILDCCHAGTMLDQSESLDNSKVVITEKSTKKVKGTRYMRPPARIVKKLKNKELVDWQTSKDVNQSALLIAGCRSNQTSADAIIDGVPQGAATAALLKFVRANPDISYDQLVNEMNSYMELNKFTQRPELDGSRRLYPQKFINPFATIIQETAADEPDSGETPVTDIGNSTVLGAVLAAIGIITLIIIALV